MTFKNHQRKLIPLGIAILIFAMWSLFIKPQIEKTARAEILKYLNNRTEFKATFKELNLNILLGKASVDLLSVELLQPEIQKYVKSVTLDKLEVHLDLFKLAIGHFGVSYISLHNMEMTLQLDPILDAPPSAPHELPIQDMFKLLETIPLGAIEINSSVLHLASQKHHFNVNLPEVDAIVSKRKTQVDLQMKLADISVKTEKLSSPPLRLSLHSVITPDHAEIKNLDIQGSSLSTTASGKILDLKNLLFFPKSTVNLQTQVDFDALMINLPPLPAFEQIRQLRGQLTLQGQASFIEKNRIQGKFDLAGSKLGFAAFHIGDVKALGQLKNDRAEISQFQLVQEAGQVHLSQVQLKLDSPFHFSANAKVKDLNTGKLFLSLDLAKIPVHASAQGELKCEGQLVEISLQCAVKADIGDFKVADHPTSTKEPPIVDIKQASTLSGDFTLSKKDFRFKSELQIGSSQGAASGTVDFEDGFQIEASSAKTFLQDLGLISNLSLVGEAQVSSIIKGNAKTAIFQIQTNIKNFEFEKYKFGDLSGLISYDRGQMFFQQLQGKKQNSQYRGDLKIHFQNKQIAGQVSFPMAELNDIQDLISQKLAIPFEFYGKGQLQIRFDGPLDLWKMDTAVDGQFNAVSIAGESFDTLDVTTRGTKGTINIEKFLLKKNQSQIVGSGRVMNTQEYQLSVNGSQLKLEESGMISKINSNVFGSLNFSAKVSGQINNPLLDLRGSISETVIDDQELLPSRFNLTMDRDRFATNFEMFGQKVAGELQIPLTQSANNPLKIKMRMNKWAYGDLFAMFGNQLLLSDYNTLISGQIDLVTSPEQNRMNYSQTDGVIAIDKFVLRRGNQLLENDRPIHVELNSGNVKIKHFELKSNDQDYLLFPPQSFTLNNLDLNFQSELNLHLLHIFLPFLEDLGGKLSLRGKVAGSYMKPALYGDATIKDGFVKLKGLVHPLEDIQSKIEFSQSKMIVQQLRAQFAQGSVTGSGFAQIVNTTAEHPETARAEGSHSPLIPLQLKLNISDMRLNVPDQVRTQGNATLTISGQSLPYLLSGEYVVKSGLVERDFTQGQDISEVQRNFYLPQQIVKKEADPLNFDIQILMDQNIIVKNPMMDGGVKGHLNLKGTPQAPLLFGKIVFDKSSQIIFRDKSFSLQNGLIEFNNPNEISPDIYVAAFTRIAEYDVNLIAQGAGKDLNIKMTSVPPLSDADLISLLALGVTSTKLEAQGSSASQAQQTGYELGSAIFSQNPLNQQIRKKLGVNLQLSSSYDSTKNASVPKIVATRKLSQKVNASVSRTVGTDETTAEVKLQYLINQNVSAIGSFENKEESTGSGLSTGEKEQKSILGIDIEYKREFK